MTFVEFSAKSFSERSVFDRKQYDVVTNSVKWLAMWLAYAL